MDSKKVNPKGKCSPMRCPTLHELSSPAPDKNGWPWTEGASQLADKIRGLDPCPLSPFTRHRIKEALLDQLFFHSYALWDPSINGSLLWIETATR